MQFWKGGNCKGNTQKLCRSTKLCRLPCSAKPPLCPAKLLRFALHTQKLCRSTKLHCLSRSAKPLLRPAKPLRSAKPLLRFALCTQPHCSASRIQPHWFVHTSPPPVCRTLRTLLFMVPLLFIIIVSCHSTHPCGFLYMYLHQHGIPILSSSDPLLGASIM